MGGRIIVSDAGLPSAADEMHAALETLGANRHIDVAILSHAHADHVGGFIGLLNTYGYTIDKAVFAWHPHYDATPTNRALIAALDVPIVRVKRGDQFFWGGASWRILNPPAGEFQGSGEEANASIAFRLRTRGADLIFTGDIEKEAQEELAAGWSFGRVEILLVTHHGSNHASSTAFFDEMRPVYSVLSTGPNSYGHPGLYALGRLKASDTTLYCTDANGNRDPQHRRCDHVASDRATDSLVAA